MINLPPYPLFPELSHERITLRAVAATDMKSLLEISFYDAKPAKSIEEAEQMQQLIDTDYTEGNSVHWCIEDMSLNAVVGTCGYYRGFENRVGELGCVLRPAYYGQGYMTEAMKLAIEFGFNVIGLQKIIAATSAHNEKAILLLKRLTFQQTDVLVDHELRFELNSPDQKMA